MIATEYNNLEIVQLLLDFNANIDMQNMNGWTALIMACYFGYENIVKYLIKHKADITIKDKNERTAFDVAEKRHLSNITKILEQADRHRKEKREKDKNYSEEEEEYLYSSESEWDSDSDNNDNEIVTEGALSSPSNSLPISKPKGDKEGISFTSKMNVQNSHQMDFESNPGNSCFENINNRKIVEKETEDSQTEISSVFDNNDNNSNNNDNNKMKALKKTKNEKRKRLSFHINDSIGVTLYQKIGWNKLHMVCMNGDIKQLNNLILENINLSERTVDGWSALHIAVSNNKIEVVKCLLDHGVDKNIENDSYTPLYIASQNGFNDIVKLLVEKYNADINKVTNGWSAIQIACSNGHYQTVEYLLSQGADIYLNSKKEYKLLHIATEENNLCMVELLLKKGHINVNAKNTGGWTALHIVARENYYGLAKYLVKYGHADVDEEDKSMNTPLHIASKYGNHTIAQLLINNKASINFKNLNGWTPLHIACQNAHTEVVRDLLENGAKVNLTTQDSKTALHIACENDNKNVIQLLMDHRANINLTTFDGWTALHFAVYYNNPTIVQYLLEYNPILTKKNKDGLSVLDIAYKMKNEDIIKLLIDYLLSIDEKANKLLLINHFNNKKEKENEEKKKKNEKEDDNIINEVISESEVLINEIKMNKFINAINIIESQKISLEYIDKNGWTALHWASYKGSTSVVKKLIDNNVKLQRKTRYGLNNTDEYKGYTAKEIAEKRGHYNVVEIIQTKIYKRRANIALNILSKATEFVADTIK